MTGKEVVTKGSKTLFFGCPPKAEMSYWPNVLAWRFLCKNDPRHMMMPELHGVRDDLLNFFNWQHYHH